MEKENKGIEPAKESVVNLITKEKALSWLKKADEYHAEWWKLAGLSYKYLETEQRPANFPSEQKVFAQINRVAESWESRMGILTNSKLSLGVRGFGEDSNDRERVNMIKTVGEHIVYESNLEKILQLSVGNFVISGLGYVRTSWDPFKRSNIGNMGMVKLESISPQNIRLDWSGSDPNQEDARFIIFKQRMNMYEFMEAFEYAFQDKSVADLTKLFDDAVMKKSGIDYDLNTGRQVDEKEITVSEIEYWRIVTYGMTNPSTGEPAKFKNGKEIIIKEREYRIAILAGGSIIADIVSPVSRIGSWTKTVFAYMKRFMSPYSDSTFKREKPIQDLFNTMVSLAVNNEARQLASPFLALKGTIENPEQWKQDIAEGGIVEWDYNSQMQASGLSPDTVKPTRLAPPQTAYAYYNLMDKVDGYWEYVSQKNAVQGSEPRQLRSGYALSLLQNAGMQPTIFLKRKVENPLQVLGNVMWNFAAPNIPDEFEIPIQYASGDSTTTIVNHIMDPSDMGTILEAVNSGDVLAIHRMKMLSIREGKERISLEVFLKDDDNLQLIQAWASGAPVEKAMENIEIVENDLTFGNYSFDLKLDANFEQTKIERIARSQIFMDLMTRAGAPMTALEYGLEITEDPNKQLLLDKVKREIAATEQKLMAQQQALMQQQQAMAQAQAQPQEGQPQEGQPQEPEGGESDAVDNREMGPPGEEMPVQQPLP